METRAIASQLTAAVLWFFAAVPAAAAATQSTIYAFHGRSDGASPEGGVIWGSDNVLYGTADSGGVNANGTIWSLTPPATAGQPWTFKVLWRMQGGSGGGYPLALTRDRSGNLFGYALDYGSGGYGIVFELIQPTVAGRAWHFQTLYQFQGGADGAYPGGGLVLLPDGSVIGTTDHGGGRGACTDPIGGNLVGCGTIYQLTPPAKAGEPWTETILHRFTGGTADGAIPVDALLSHGGAIWGVTVQGGSGPCADSNGYLVGCGTVYKLSETTPGKWSESVEYSFQGGKLGQSPIGGLGVDSRGALYGVTTTGGVAHSPASDPSGDGIVYRLTPATGGLKLQAIHTLGAAGDGREPLGGVVVQPDGTVFGTTYLGPDGYFGTVFKVSPPAAAGARWTESVLGKFGTPGGVYLTGQIAQDPAGAIYGVTLEGGRFNAGTVYSVAP